MAFMFEGRYVIEPSQAAMDSTLCRLDYDDVRNGFRSSELPR